MPGGLRGIDLLVLPRDGLAKAAQCVGSPPLTPAMTTSYFSSDPVGSNFGLRRGTGGAKEGRTRRSREDMEYSVKTGIVQLVVALDEKTRTDGYSKWRSADQITEGKSAVGDDEERECPRRKRRKSTSYIHMYVSIQYTQDITRASVWCPKEKPMVSPDPTAMALARVLRLITYSTVRNLYKLPDDY